MPIIGSLGAAASRGFGQFLQKITAVINTDAFFKYVSLLLTGNPPVSTFVTDASTNNLQVTINGNTTPSGFSPNEGGYYSNYFIAGTDYINTPNEIALIGDYTIETWFSLVNAQTSYQMICGQSVSGGGQYISINAAGIEFFLGGGDVPRIYYTFATTTWYHFAIVRSGTTVSVYINGVSQSVTSPTQSATVYMKYIGAGYSTAFPIGGYMSNFRIVNGTAVYTSNFTPSTTPLTAITNTALLTCQSNRFIDNSASALALTVTGSPTVNSLQPFTPNPSFATYGSTYFDGSGDYLLTPTSTSFGFGTGDFTVEFWAYSTVNARQDWLDITNGTQRILIYYSGSAVTVYTTPPNSAAITGGALVLNAWNHYAVSKSGGNLRLFVNGVQAGSTYTTNQDYGSTNLVCVGKDYYGSTYITGYMSNLRIVKGTALYTAAFTPPTTQLTAVTNTSLLTCQTNQPVNNNVFLDSSSNNFAITRAGNTTQGSLNPYGGNWSVQTDNGANLSVPANTALRLTGDFTIEAWIYPTTVGNSVIVGSDAGSPSDYFGILSNRIQIGINGGSYPTWTTSFVANTWYHVALTRSSNFLRAFVNGTQLTLASGSATNSGTMFQANALLIGKYGYTPSPAPFYGNISNLRLVKGTALYTASFTPPTAPLTAVTNTVLLTCQSNRYVDNSTNNFTVSATGNPKAQAFSPFSPVAPYTPATYSGSMYFDGTTDYLTLATNPQLGMGSGDFTVEFWTYQTSLVSYRQILDVVDGNSVGRLILWVDSAGTIYNLGQNGNARNTSAAGAIVANTWVHVVLTRLSGTTKFYINGVQSGTNYTDSTNYTCTSGSVYIGINSDGGTYPYIGYISNFRMVKGTAIYTANFTPPTAPLQAVTNTTLLLLGSNGAVYDSAIFNDAETVGDAKVTTAVSKFGGSSVSFDGSGDSLMIPASNRYQFQANYTIELWVYFNSVTGTQDILGNYVSSTAVDWTLLIDNQTIQYYPSSAASFVWGPAMSTNTWYHIALVRSGTTCSMYVNGVSVGTPLTFSTVLGSPTKPLYVGSRAGGSNYFNGYIDDLRITNGYARYTQNFAVPTEPFPVQ